MGEQFEKKLIRRLVKNADNVYKKGVKYNFKSKKYEATPWLKKRMVANAAIGAGEGAIIGAATTINLKKRLRRKHPDWTEDQINKETRRIRTKRSLIGAGIGGATSSGFDIYGTKKAMKLKPEWKANKRLIKDWYDL